MSGALLLAESSAMDAPPAPATAAAGSSGSDSDDDDSAAFGYDTLPTGATR